MIPRTNFFVFRSELWSLITFTRACSMKKESLWSRCTAWQRQFSPRWFSLSTRTLCLYVVRVFWCSNFSVDVSIFRSVFMMASKPIRTHLKLMRKVFYLICFFSEDSGCGECDGNTRPSGGVPSSGLEKAVWGVYCRELGSGVCSAHSADCQGPPTAASANGLRAVYRGQHPMGKHRTVRLPISFLFPQNFPEKKTWKSKLKFQVTRLHKIKIKIQILKNEKKID